MGESAFIHLGLIKGRFTGNGLMSLSLNTFDGLDPIGVVGFTLTPTGNRVLQRLCNYTAQGIIVGGAATAIDDTVRCQDITLFFKQMWAEYPM